MTAVVASPLDLQVAASAAEVHAFLDRLPAHLKRGRISQLRRECAALLDRAPAEAGERWTRLRQSLAELRAGLDSGAARAYVLAKYEDAARAYEHWVASHRASNAGAPEAASLKPLKGARTWFHVAMGLTATGLYTFALTRAQSEAVLLVLLAIFATLEVTRRMSGRWNHLLVTGVFKTIARPREYYRINSATYYLAALCLVTPVFSQAAVLTGVLILGFGDPAAAWIGKAWGHRKLYRNKSLAGSLAFVAAGVLSSGAYLVAFHPELPLASRLGAAALASLCGAVAELFSARLDDNLTVPIAAVLAAALFV